MVRITIFSRFRRGAQDPQTELRNTEHEKREVQPQVALAFQHFLNTMAVGMSMGHAAVLVPQLQAENKDFEVDEETGSWITSVYMFMGPLGCFAGGIILEKIGRRMGLIVGDLVFILGWSMIAAAQSPLMLICGRILDGIAVGIITSSGAILFDELAHPRLRGTVLCMASSIMSVGMLIMSTLGAFLNWRLAASIAIIPSVLHVPILAFLVCETPTFLVKKQRLKEAERSLYWLWGPRDIKVKEELEDLMRRISKSDEDKKEDGHQNILQKLSKSLKEYIAPYILKPFIIIHIFNLLQMPGGMGLLTLYTVDIVNRVQGEGQVLNGNLANIIISAIKVAILLLSAFLLYRIGRRPIAIISGVGSTVPALAVGVILYVKTTQKDSTLPPGMESWINFTLILIYIAMNTLGFYCLTYTMIGEVLPSKVRGVLFGYIVAANYLVGGGVAKAYPWLISAMGMHGLFLLFGVTCAVCTAFVYLFLPETLNQTLEEIEDYFHQPNIMWITRKKMQDKDSISERL